MSDIVYYVDSENNYYIDTNNAFYIAGIINDFYYHKIYINNKPYKAVVYRNNEFIPVSSCLSISNKNILTLNNETIYDANNEEFLVLGAKNSLLVK